MSKAIVLYLHVHQPWRVREYSAFDTGKNHDYWDAPHFSGANNEKILRKVAEKSYFPTNKILLQMLREHPEFRFSISITGTFIEECEKYLPELLDSFRELIDTGRVEIVGETYYHSLAFFYSRDEFARQVEMHAKKIEQVFGVKPTKSLRNTELSYNNDLGNWADSRGYTAVITEGWEKNLGWRSPNFVYRPPQAQKVKLLLKNYKLSDDFAFRFSNRGWSEWPLSMKKYGAWLDAEDAPLVNLFVDYETFGEHQWKETGIFDFLREMPRNWLARPEHTFMTISEAANHFDAVGEYNVPHTITWADSERDLSAWLGNRMQQEAESNIYALEQEVLATNDVALIGDWRRMTTSDHPYYMSTKYWNDGDVHAYFSPYQNPYDAFIYYMNALRDIRFRLIQHQENQQNRENQEKNL